jgi:hypothetical protein
MIRHGGHGLRHGGEIRLGQARPGREPQAGMTSGHGGRPEAADPDAMSSEKPLCGHGRLRRPERHADHRGGGL